MEFPCDNCIVTVSGNYDACENCTLVDEYNEYTLKQDKKERVKRYRKITVEKDVAVDEKVY